MRPKSIILLVLALGCGLVAAIGINQVIAGRGETVVVEGESVPIFVATADINTNDPVTQSVVKLEPWPKDKVPPGALRRMEDMDGRRTKTKLFSGSPVLEAQLLPKGADRGSAGDNIPTGFRVVAVRVDDQTSSGNLILPGDRVDVLVHLQQNGRAISETTTKTFLQDVKVFAVNDIIDRGDRGEERITARTVSLLVKPDQAELVTLASELGRIRLVMRGPNDPNTETLEGKTTSELLGPSERGDRAAQTPVAAASNPLLDMLAHQAQPKPAMAASLVEAVQAALPFTMTVIRGPTVEEVQLDPASKVGHPKQAAAAPLPGTPNTDDESTDTDDPADTATSADHDDVEPQQVE